MLGDFGYATVAKPQQAAGFFQAQLSEVPSEAHSARLAKAGSKMAFADANRRGHFLRTGRFGRAENHLVDLREKAARSRRAFFASLDWLHKSDTFKHQSKYGDREVVVARHEVGLNEFQRQSFKVGGQVKRIAAEFLQVPSVVQIEGYKEPKQIFALRLGVVVKLERENQKRFSGMERNRLVVNAHGSRGFQVDNKNAPMVQSTSALGAIEV